MQWENGDKAGGDFVERSFGRCMPGRMGLLVLALLFLPARSCAQGRTIVLTQV